MTRAFFGFISPTPINTITLTSNFAGSSGLDNITVIPAVVATFTDRNAWAQATGAVPTVVQGGSPFNASRCVQPPAETAAVARVLALLRERLFASLTSTCRCGGRARRTKHGRYGRASRERPRSFACSR